MDKILEVKELKISFRTSGGTVKAVRDISFDLERGKTLAIVGESGSGKSVTSKAVLGILAGNSIIEGGEILYDGKDLLKISEEEMYKLRGDKLSMVFQDPLSSLNPIVKIGRQITEAMLLKNKANRREARKEFNSLLEELRKNMAAATGAGSAAKVKQMTETFDRFCIQANRLENHYNQDESEAESLIDAIEDFLFKAEKGQKQDTKAALKDFADRGKNLKDVFFTRRYAHKLNTCLETLHKTAAECRSVKAKENTPLLPDSVKTALEELKALLEEMTGQEKPNFFRIGYYQLRKPQEDLGSCSIEELNQKALDFLNDDFMTEFLKLEEKGVKYSYETALEKKKKVLSGLAQAREYFRNDFDKAEGMKLCRELSCQVEDSIDRLEFIKDSAAYTFRSSMQDAISKYFYYKAHNPKEETRYARQTKRRDALIARGKTVDWKVVPKVVYDPKELRGNILKIIDRLEKNYQAYIQASDRIDFRKRSIDIVDFLKGKASDAVYRITKSMARERAVKLMDEVGISDPRMRYNQYPFEFSGGMRQRIVIAIALAADPEILICDEPTTALDVTIQAQILELINRLKRERNLSVIFITHDLGVVANMADDIAVMYAGKIVEYGSAEDIFYDPRHPYTWALLSSMPDLDTNEKPDTIPGTPPNMIYPPQGDAFAARNKYALKIDFELQPPMFEVSPGHKAATWLLHPDAPKVEVPKIITDRIERMKHGGEQNGQ